MNRRAGGGEREGGPLRRAWGRLVGPGATPAENAGTLLAAAAGAVVAAAAVPADAPLPAPARRAVAALLGADVVGGTWCNSTGAALRWYGRDGQTGREHLGFAAAHLHPFLAGPDRRWAAAHYLGMLAAVGAVRVAPRPLRRPLGATLAMAAIVADRALPHGPAPGWFVPAYWTKLVAGHATSD